MAIKPVKKQNDLNIFLNDYFNIILAVALILFLVLAYLVFLGPKFRSTQEAINANTEEKRLLFQATQKRLASLKAVSDTYEKINSADLQKFNSVLPDNYVKERLFGELEEVIGRGGWIVSNIIISSSEEGGLTGVGIGQIGNASTTVLNKKIGSVNLTFSVAGVDYAGFKNLLHLLENNLRLFDITSVTFSPAGNSANINLSTYYYKSL